MEPVQVTPKKPPRPRQTPKQATPKKQKHGQTVKKKLDGTPKKLTAELCLVCGEYTTIKVLIHSYSGEKKNLTGLLETYGGVTINHGAICRNCERRLITLDKNAVEFRNLCQKTCLKAKRCARSPADRSKKTKISKSMEKASESFKSVISSPHSQAAHAQERSRVRLNFEASTPLSSKRENTPACSIPFSTHDLQTATEFFTPILPRPIANPENSGYDDSMTTNSQDISSFHHNHTSLVQQCAPSNQDIQTGDHTYGANSSVKSGTNASKKTTSQKQLDPLSQELKSLHDASLKDSEDTITSQMSHTITTSLRLHSLSYFIKSILSIKQINRAVTNFYAKELYDQIASMGNRKNDTSIFMEKDTMDLMDFQWDQLVQEMLRTVPSFVQLALAVLLPEDASHVRVQKAKHRLAMSFASLLQGRHRELSKVQRLVTVLLQDNICDQKVIFQVSFNNVNI